MKTQVNSINQKGCSVCAKGEEKYTTFRPAHFPIIRYYQYDYRHKDGELFSTVAPTLQQCREQRLKWVQKKNYQRLCPFILKKIQDNKRLSMYEISYQIGKIAPRFSGLIDLDIFSYEEIVVAFNRMFGTEIRY